MRLTAVSLLVAATLLTPLAAHDSDDKRPLEHEDYDRWNSMISRSISRDGVWISYSYRNGKSQSTLKIRNTKTDREYTIKNASSAQLTPDGSRAIYTIKPDPQLVKKLKKEDKDDDIPQDRFVILNLESGDSISMQDVKSWAIPRENSAWIAMLLKKPKHDSVGDKGKAEVNEVYEITGEGLKRSKEKPEPTAETIKESGKSKAPKEATKTNDPKAGEVAKEEAPQQAESKTASEKEAVAKDKKKNKAEGTMLVLHSLVDGSERRYANVVSFDLSRNGSHLAFATSTKAGGTHDGVFVVDTRNSRLKQLIDGTGNYSHLTFSKDGTLLTFLADKDDYETKTSASSVYFCNGFKKRAQRVAFKGDKGIPEGWWISSKVSPSFSEDKRRLYFSTAPVPEDLDKDDSEKEDPKAKLDLWHWKDPLLQPEQLLQATKERNRSYQAVYDLKRKTIRQLATKEMPNVTADRRSSSDIAMGTSSDKYRRIASWESPGFTDIYTVDLKTGKSELLVEKVRGFGQLSPDGKFIAWWDADKRAYFAASTADRKPVKISHGVSFADELNDRPMAPRSYGTAGWLQDDSGLLVYDRYDIWRLDPTGAKQPLCVTGQFGRQHKTRFRYIKLDSEQRAIDADRPAIVSTFDGTTKASGFSRVNLGNDSEPKSLVMLDESVGNLSKAKNSDAVMFGRSSFRKCSDIWFSTTRFKNVSRISRINPQQHEYTWGTSELVHWNSSDGRTLDGILYKPEGFDPNKKYPLMVYFYERNSDNLHRYYTPAAGRSIINFSFYVSRSYVLFVPDIPYTTGFPGESAEKAVLPGVESIVAQGFINKERIGMQGHSWGGYQTAYLVTQTNMFACAESGAPVSNMTSAYGGIRWGSGKSRMFQYERTQSRIGRNLWDGRERYIANSPVFHADKINTPLLILHNDQDGAVPWYQGIELFVAMRRLSKPAWMLNYNGEPHWVMKEENRLDFAKRMQQFFDHYLKDQPQPEWMASGIPAVDKGRKFGFEPVKKKEVEKEKHPATRQKSLKRKP
jgi:dipeptidyl aminopeptidase/acylaminoacyl peptidase